MTPAHAQSYRISIRVPNTRRSNEAVSSGDVTESAESSGAHHPAQPPLQRRRTIGELGIACSPTVVTDTNVTDTENVGGLLHDEGMLAVTTAFGEFRGNLEITGLQESVVAARQERVRAAVAGGLTVRDSFLTGSYRRHTLIGPMREADVDIVVVLDRSYRPRGPRAVLDLVKDILRETFPSSKISRNGQAVTISFSDFTVDVVPAFATWWDSEIVDICNSGDGTWIRTSPKRHIDISSKVNKRTGGLLIPSVKMLKAWNRAAGRPLRSFHLEVLAWKVFDPGVLSAAWWGPGVGMGSDGENVSRFFAEAAGRLRGRLRDPALNEGDVGAYLTERARDEAISRVATAASRCQQAGQLLAEGNAAGANALYRKVFGDAFPR